MQQYLKYILKQDDEELEKATAVLVDVVNNNSYSWYVKLSGYQMIIRLQDLYSQKVKS